MAGDAAINSYRDDPICQAHAISGRWSCCLRRIRKQRQDGLGQKVYGHVHSPGIDPSVITVGAVDTKGSNGRSDDGIATSAHADPRVAGGSTISASAHDNLVKPDLAAPGNKLVFAKSPNNDWC